MEVNAINHDQLKERWKLLINEDPETYNQDFLRGRYQNQRLQEFMDYERELSLEAGEPFNPVESVMRFNDELHDFPEGQLSEADEVKLKFTHEPGHERWRKVMEASLKKS